MEIKNSVGKKSYTCIKIIKAMDSLRKAFFFKKVITSPNKKRANSFLVYLYRLNQIKHSFLVDPEIYFFYPRYIFMNIAALN